MKAEKILQVLGILSFLLVVGMAGLYFKDSKAEYLILASIPVLISSFWIATISQRVSNIKTHEVLNEAVSAIYFNDKSDYLPTLYKVVLTLTDIPTRELDIDELYKQLNKDNENSNT